MDQENPALAFLTKKGNRGTLKRLIEFIDIDNTVRLLYPDTWYMIGDNDILVRWGCTTTIHAQHRDDLVVNNRIDIIRASNKMETRSMMMEKNISCPQISMQLPCIARRIKHKKGKDLVFCTTQSQVTNAKRMGYGYFQEYIHKDKEYRVHVAHSGVLAVQEKVDTDDDREKYPINWNHTNGFVFEPVKWSQIPKGLCKLAIDACSVLALDFGAVDIIEKDNQFYVLEVNTAPAVEDYVASRYAEYFSWLYKYYIKKDELPSHFKDRKKYIIRREEMAI